VKIGDVVKITAGPFAGFQGMLKSSAPRVLLVVEISGRQLDVEMDLDWVSAEAQERRPAIGSKRPAVQRHGKGA
jgi:hypothetical protein